MTFVEVFLGVFLAEISKLFIDRYLRKNLEQKLDRIDGELKRITEVLKQ